MASPALTPRDRHEAPVRDTSKVRHPHCTSRTSPHIGERTHSHTHTCTHRISKIAHMRMLQGSLSGHPPPPTPWAHDGVQAPLAAAEARFQERQQSYPFPPDPHPRPLVTEAGSTPGGVSMRVPFPRVPSPPAASAPGSKPGSPRTGAARRPVQDRKSVV